MEQGDFQYFGKLTSFCGFMETQVAGWVSMSPDPAVVLCQGPYVNTGVNILNVAWCYSGNIWSTVLLNRETVEPEACIWKHLRWQLTAVRFTGVRYGGKRRKLYTL